MLLLWDELRDLQSTIPALNVMRRILEYYFLQLCGYEGSDLREIVLDEHRNKFIKQVEGEKPDMTDYQLASSLLAYINNPNGISDGLNYVEDCEDVEAYKRGLQDDLRCPRSNPALQNDDWQKGSSPDHFRRMSMYDKAAKLCRMKSEVTSMADKKIIDAMWTILR